MNITSENVSSSPTTATATTTRTVANAFRAFTKGREGTAASVKWKYVKTANMIERDDTPMEATLKTNDNESTSEESKKDVENYIQTNDNEFTSEEPKEDVETHLFIKDHFSLHNPSTTIAFADKKTHVFTNGTDQLTLDISGGVIEAKETSIATAPLFLVRSAYALVAALMAGFLLAFCIQLLLFLFVTLLIQINKTATPKSSFIVLGTILSIPTAAKALASAMVIAASFVKDTWYGHSFIKSVLSSNSVLTDWITFSVFFLIPVVVGTGFLYAENDRWWEFTSVTWFICVSAYYLLFSALVIYHELRGCYEMVRHNKVEKYEDKNLGQPAEFFDVIKQAILLRQVRALSGFSTVSYIAQEQSTTTDYKKAKDTDKSTGIKCRITLMFVKVGWYKSLEEPKQVYDVDEVRERYPLVTRTSWGLEQLFFRDPNEHFMAIVKGENAITNSQAHSSFVCVILGQLLTLLFVVSFMLWFESSRFLIAFVIIIVILYGCRKLRSSYALLKVHQKIMEDTAGNSDIATSLTLIRHKFRVSEPTKVFCWLHLFTELVLFKLIPIIALFLAGNAELAGVFFNNLCHYNSTICRCRCMLSNAWDS